MVDAVIPAPVAPAARHREEILAVLRASAQPLSGRQVEKAAGGNSRAIRWVLAELVAAGQVVPTGWPRGRRGGGIYYRVAGPLPRAGSTTVVDLSGVDLAGAARAAVDGAELLRSALDRSGRFGGTPAYMAPEHRSAT